MGECTCNLTKTKCPPVTVQVCHFPLTISSILFTSLKGNYPITLVVEPRVYSTNPRSNLTEQSSPSPDLPTCKKEKKYTNPANPDRNFCTQKLTAPLCVRGYKLRSKVRVKGQCLRSMFGTYQSTMLPFYLGYILKVNVEVKGQGQRSGS